MSVIQTGMAKNDNRHCREEVDLIISMGMHAAD
jgi:hypothetical protein